MWILRKPKESRLLQDRVTAFATPIDDSVKRISVAYNQRGLLASVGSYNHASVGSGTLLNEVGRVYDGFGQMSKDQQAHSGAVDPGTTPEVGYTHADGSSGNTARRTGMTYPDGRVLESGYGASGSADDLLSRVASLAIAGESGNLAQYTFVGAARYVKIAYPEPGVQLSYIKTSNPHRPRAFGGKGAEGLKSEFLAAILTLSNGVRGFTGAGINSQLANWIGLDVAINAAIGAGTEGRFDPGGSIGIGDNVSNLGNSGSACP